jgi:hypothetical protein
MTFRGGVNVHNRCRMKSLKVRFGHLIILHIRLACPPPQGSKQGSTTRSAQRSDFRSDEIHVVCLDEHQGIASRPVPMLSKVPRHPLALLLKKRRSPCTSCPMAHMQAPVQLARHSADAPRQRGTTEQLVVDLGLAALTIELE